MADSLEQQVQAYTKVRDDYKLLGRRLEEVLERARERLAPEAFVHTRVKTISSFAEKVLRKQYDDPARELTDLCGARVVARTRSEVDAFARFLEGQFEIDEENSSDTSQRLKPTEFGYRSVHYIVSFKPGVDYGVVIEPNLYGLKAEIQLRTVAEHAYADFGHDLSYKGAFELPVPWKRELAGIAASVEGIDQAFDRIEKGVRAYASSYGAYKDEKQLREEIARLELVLAYEPDVKLALRIGRLAMTLEDWFKAEQVLSKHIDARRPEDADRSVLSDYGYCLCNLHRSEPAGDDYGLGQRHLKLASITDSAGSADPQADVYLADTWAWAGDDARARDLYRRAYEADETDTYALARFLQYELGLTGRIETLAPLGPTLEAATARCRAQAAVKVNVPRVYFGIGTFLLLQNSEEQAREALKAYAKAVQASTGAGIIADELHSLEKLTVIADRLVGYEWARRMLLLGLATKALPSGADNEESMPENELARKLRERERELRREARAELSKLSSGKIVHPALRATEPETKPSVVIVVGGTDPEVQKKLDEFRELILQAFRDFNGIVISGGTREGVSGFVGEASEKYGERISAFAHHPRELPTDGTATRDDRYDEIRILDDQPSFSPLQPLQDWIDILETDIDPRDAKILGLNGGRIAEVEFRIGLGLGASVAVLVGTGRAAADLLRDEAWAVSETLLPMPIDPQTVRAFIGPGVPPLDSYIQEEMAKLIHEHHREQTVYTQPTWDKLEERKKKSSRSQAEHNILKLHMIGCEAYVVDEPPTELFTFTDDEIEQLAEMEHGRWTAELLMDGWRVGDEKDEEAKTHHLLVAWKDLPEEEREWDRSFVRAIPELLARFHRDIREVEPNPERPPRRKREERSSQHEQERPTVRA